MKPGYYIYTMFVFVLICAVMLIARKVFSDFKRQSELLDEKEKKLLELYSTIEEVMEGFYDEVGDCKEDISAAMRKLNNEAGRRQTQPAKIVYSQDKEPEKPKIFDFIVDEDLEEPMPVAFRQAMQVAEEDTREQPPVSEKNQNILSMHKKGKSVTEIAKELSITQTEVSLVIGISNL